jgi:hypothetical protein
MEARGLTMRLFLFLIEQIATRQDIPRPPDLVIPAKAGIHEAGFALDPRLRGDDKKRKMSLVG